MQIHQDRNGTKETKIFVHDLSPQKVSFINEGRRSWKQCYTPRDEGHQFEPPDDGIVKSLKF